MVKDVSITRIKKIFESSTEIKIYTSSIVDITKIVKVYRRSELHHFSSVQSIEDKTVIINLIKESLKISNYVNIDVKIIKFEENIFEGKSVFTCYYSVIKNSIIVRNIDIQRITTKIFKEISTKLNILSIRKEKITFVESEKIIRKTKTLSILIKNSVSRVDFIKLERVIKKSIEEKNSIKVNIKIVGTEEYINEFG